MAPPKWNDDISDEYDDNLDDEDYTDDDASELVPCPHCGAQIHEESEQCPVCGTYVTHETSVWKGRSWLWIAFGMLGIIAVLLVLLLGM